MANLDNVFVGGTTNRGLPGTIPDGIQQIARVSRRGEFIHQSLTGSKMWGLADEGSLFVATNATLGTAIVGTTAPTAFSATVGLMTIFNNNTVASGKRLYLDEICLEVRAAGASSTQFSVAMSIDGIQRYSSGGTAITPINPNMDDGTVSAATVNFGALTCAAASTGVRRLWHGQVRTVIKVVGDRYRFRFGDSATPNIGMIMEGTAQAEIVLNCPAMVLGPQQTFILHEIAASQGTAAQYEFVARWVER
jgi:hypothetical protein